MEPEWIIGIDKAGRGPLAGPVAVGAVALPAARAAWSCWAGLKDSKQLTEKQRETWYGALAGDPHVRSAVALSDAATIDADGIVPAILDAAQRAIASLSIRTADAEVLLDRGISLPAAWRQEQHTKGDERFPAIALASIMAKVTRDRYMVRLAQEHPLYGFERHKGYGTKLHQERLRAHGPIPRVHRLTFITGLTAKAEEV
ncbi:MAG TPA: ribonuclease HII [Candidatus Paceibacterota bacterium]|nr:ribonuclease HII [Candidatus Paceibacterota bacterium]